MFQETIILVAQGFGLGSLPLLATTLGAALGIPLAWLTARAPASRQLFTAAALTAVAVPLCHVAWLEGGRRDGGGLGVVLDDVAANLHVWILLAGALAAGRWYRGSGAA